MLQPRATPKKACAHHFSNAGYIKFVLIEPETLHATAWLEGRKRARGGCLQSNKYGTRVVGTLLSDLRALTNAGYSSKHGANLKRVRLEGKRAILEPLCCVCACVCQLHGLLVLW